MQEKTERKPTLRCAPWLALAGLLAMTTAAAAELTTEELCAYRFTRMAAAQTSRIVKEIAKCVRRNHSSYQTTCTPHVSADADLDADEDVLKRALRHVERHGDNKFPRKCAGVRPDFFDPACSDIVDTASQLRRCLYNDHTIPFVVEILADIAAFTDDERCATQIARQIHFTWRDWILLAADEPDTGMTKKLKRMTERISAVCDAEDTADFLAQAFERVREHTAEMRAVVPFELRRDASVSAAER